MMLGAEKYGGLLLLALFILICGVLAIRIHVEATHYISPDSHLYLQASEKISAYLGYGNPLAPEREGGEVAYFALWPAGYPSLIAVVGALFQTSPFLASKLVNGMFLAFTFLLLYRWYGKLAWFPALYFCSINMLEVYSYSWSEGAFLFFVLALCYVLETEQKQGKDSFLALKLTICLFSLFLLRYAGIIYVIFVAAYFVYLLHRRSFEKNRVYVTALALSLLLIIGYFILNKQTTGYYTGGDRIFPTAESFSYFSLQLLEGLLNELAITRNFYFLKAGPDLLFILLFALQAVLMFFIFRSATKVEASREGRKVNLILLWAGLFYLFVLIILRKLSPFETFNYRILAPFSLPIFIYLFGLLTEVRNRQLFKRVSPWITAFMLLSLLMNLPKVYLLELIAGK